ncbi:MAG: glycosyltransferase family 4 protein [Proteobacteria bacterium]|nr:glycosyltransferase family 4 protein [Pseudomonadota bacterium]
MHAPPRVLYVLHDLHEDDPIAQQTRGLLHGLAGRGLAVYPAARELVLEDAWGRQRRLPAGRTAWALTPWRAPELEAALTAVLRGVNPDVVHVQHFGRWPLRLFVQLRAFGAPVVLSHHGSDELRIDGDRLSVLGTGLRGHSLAGYRRLRSELLATGFERVAAHVSSSARVAAEGLQRPRRAIHWLPLEEPESVRGGAHLAGYMGLYVDLARQVRTRVVPVRRRPEASPSLEAG